MAKVQGTWWKFCCWSATWWPCPFRAFLQLWDPVGRQCLGSQVHPPPGTMGPQFWEQSVNTNLNDSNFNNPDIFGRTWNKALFCIPLDCFWLLATSNKLLGNKKQMENNRSNYIAGWMFHFKYYCLCEDIQHGCVIAKRNMHWSLYQETGMTVLCKYYFIYCQQL